jgi:DNA-binding GntR family transcriptional regulator
VEKVFATAQHEALDHIRAKIMTGEYPGGMRINSNDIATKLNCSRIPIREALRQLEAEGFITMLPNRGAVVATLTPEAVADLFDIRCALELIAFEATFDRLTDSAMAELLVLKDRMDRHRENKLLWVEHHDRFHQFIASMSGRDQLCKEIARIHHAVRPYILLGMTDAEHVEVKGHDHQLIVDAIKYGDPQKGLDVMRDHLKGVATILIDFLRSRSEQTDSRHTTTAGKSASDRTGGLIRAAKRLRLGKV